MTDFEKRCADCACLVSVGGVACCNECFNQPIEQVDDCPEGVTLEDVEKMSDIKVKVDHGVANQRKKSDKPRTVKVSDEKVALFSEIFSNLEDVYPNCVRILKENKLIEVKIGEIVFKVDIIQQRSKKI